MTSAPPLLAAFITPTLFFGGAAAMAAPILIHLLARRRFRRIRWAAMEFLIDAERRNRRRIRMEEWILLALRCLAVLFIALMVARPFTKKVGVAALLGGSQRTERVFVLDDSLSMAYQSPDGRVFGRAKLAVRRLLESIRREAPDDTVTLLRMSAPTAPVESGTYLDDTQTEELLARLEALSPTQRSIEPANVVEGVAEVLQRSPGITSAAVYIISDFQRHDWAGTGRPPTADKGAEASEPPASAGAESQTPRESQSVGSPRGLKPAARSGSGILEPLKAWAGEDRGLRLVLINVGEQDAANMAITELAAHGGPLVAGTTATVRAKVANYTNEPVENLELQVSVGHLTQPSKTLRELAPDQSASVELEAEFLRAGFEAVRVELPPDALPADNVRHVVAEVANAIRVLITDGEPSADSFEDEVTFLATALRPEGEAFSGNEVVVVDEAQLEEVNLAGFHVVVLANVYRLSEPVIDNLERFVRQGGGLLVFLGDQVDAELYNAALYRDGEGLLPAELTEVIRAQDASHLTITDRLHPAMRGLSGEGDPLGIGQIAFLEYFGCVPFARVIARFDDADEHPAIIEHRFGRGTVILVTTAVDKEWHQWPDHPTFLPVMMELVRHVARRSDTGTEHWVGETIELPLDLALYEPDAFLRTPAYPNEREVGLTAAPAGTEPRASARADSAATVKGATTDTAVALDPTVAPGPAAAAGPPSQEEATEGEGPPGLTLSWEHTDVSGLYQFVLKTREGGETVRLAAVNIDPRESDLTMAREDELRRVMGGVPFEYVDGIDKLTGAVEEARTELWRLFLFAAAAVLMTEQCLAFWWGRRKV